MFSVFSNLTVEMNFQLRKQEKSHVKQEGSDEYKECCTRMIPYFAKNIETADQKESRIGIDSSRFRLDIIIPLYKLLIC